LENGERLSSRVFIRLDWTLEEWKGILEKVRVEGNCYIYVAKITLDVVEETRNCSLAL